MKKFDCISPINAKSLACMHAPETSHTPYGIAGRKVLKGLLPVGSDVTLRSKANDRYGRTVAEISKDDINIQQLLVAKGIAPPYETYAEQ